MKKEQLNKAKIKDYHSKKINQQLAGKSYKIYDLLQVAIIVLLGIIIYSNSFGCTFHFDDLGNIVDNEKIRNLWDVKAWLGFDPSRTFGIFSFVLTYHFFKLDVHYWHLVNLLIHLVNACFVWWLVRLICNAPAMKDYPIVKHRKWLAFATALLFVSHPLATESVTYIVQRVSSQAAMFYLLSIALYVKARIKCKGKTNKYLLFAVSFISGLLAIFTKENAFTLPFAILLFEFFFIRTKKPSINLKDYRVLSGIAGLAGIIIVTLLLFSFSIFGKHSALAWACLYSHPA